MHHLNYCRQMVKQFNEQLHFDISLPGVAPAQYRSLQKQALKFAAKAEKFILPAGGYVLEDEYQLRALDDGGTVVRLPFPTIALEYEYPEEVVTDGERSPKRVIFAFEVMDGSGAFFLGFMPVSYIERLGSWQVYPVCFFHEGEYFQRDSAHDLPVLRVYSDLPFEKYPQLHDDMVSEARVLLGFLNTLACSNVEVVRSSAGSTRKAMGKKGALPFDDYHLLMVRSRVDANAGCPQAGSHRSPREHLRRGHIRRLQDGRKLWVNATIVNPGVGGKVQKDYRVCA